MARIGARKKGRSGLERTPLYIAAKVLDYFVIACTIVFVIFAGFLAGAKFLGYNEYVVLSGSMEPGIMTGSLAFVNTKDLNVQEGDIIAFTIDREDADLSYDSDATTVTHRVVKINSDGSYTTKGDNNETQDTKHIEPSQVIGKYSFNIPELGYLMSSLGNKGILVIICWIVALNIITSVFVQLTSRD